MEKNYITIDGVKIYHGDKISAVIIHLDEDYELQDARLCINDLKDGYAYICQNECDGDSSALDKFGYKYSWSFRVEEGKIITTDTVIVRLEEKPLEEEDDDDPMPVDWVCEEKIPEDI